MKRLLALLAGSLIIVTVVLSSGPPKECGEEEIVVEFLDVGQGDSTVIRSPEGKVALIDAGTAGAKVAGTLKKGGVKSLELVVLTHPHSDHVGGMAETIKQFEPEAFLDRAGTTDVTQAYKKARDAAKDAESTTIRPKAKSERKINLGSVKIRVFPQPPMDEDNPNNNSIGLRVEYKGFSVLITGDSEHPEREWWEEKVDKELYSNVTVLRIAHHGSNTGTDDKWLKATNPKLAVISCGEGNKYKHPHKETLELIDKFKIPLKRTDLDGTIVVTSNGKTWKIKGEKEEQMVHQKTDGRKKAQKTSMLLTPPRRALGCDVLLIAA